MTIKLRGASVTIKLRGASRQFARARTDYLRRPVPGGPLDAPDLHGLTVPRPDHERRQELLPLGRRARALLPHKAVANSLPYYPLPSSRTRPDGVVYIDAKDYSIYL